MIFKRALVWAAVVCGPAAMAIGADAAPPPQAGFSLTIYSNADPATFDPQDYVRQQTLIEHALPGVVGKMAVCYEQLIKQHRLLPHKPQLSSGETRSPAFPSTMGLPVGGELFPVLFDCFDRR